MPFDPAIDNEEWPTEPVGPPLTRIHDIKWERDNPESYPLDRLRSQAFHDRHLGDKVRLYLIRRDPPHVRAGQYNVRKVYPNGAMTDGERSSDALLIASWLWHFVPVTKPVTRSERLASWIKALFTGRLRWRA